MQVLHSLTSKLAITLLGLGLYAHAFAFGPLISAQDLNQSLEAQDSPLLIDIRAGSNDENAPAAFEIGHVPGSVNAPYALFRGPKQNPGQLIEEDQLEQLLQSLGVTFDRAIVIVYQGKDETDFGAAARVYWTLKSSGLTQLAILNGGLNAWTSQGLALEIGKVEPASVSNIDITFADTWLATREDIQNYVNPGSGTRLIDARPENFWSGNAKHPAALSPGTLPTSSYFEHARWFSPDQPTLINVSAVPALAKDNGFETTDAIVSFCNTGHWAATNWFALSELAGIETVKLYPESLVGWSNAGGQLANVPGVFQNLINKIAGRY